MKKYILIASCPEKIGIVRAVSNFIYSEGASIVDAAQFTDMENNRFNMRWELVAGTRELPGIPDVAARFTDLAEELSMEWQLRDADDKPKILIAVSKYGHCLNDLLYRWTEEEYFPAEIVGVVSNHEDFRDKVEWYGLPFYHLPITPETKPQQEQKFLDIMTENEVDLLVLARYMQILSDRMCRQLEGRAINIHHSFLPSFKGAKPYQQAFDRGVKIMGATAHYVTSDLDEGPIIEQDIQRVEHDHDSAIMVARGKSVETIVLARAVYWHCQHRVILNKNKTVIFK